MRKFRVYQMSGGRWWSTSMEVHVDTTRGQNPILAAQMQHKDLRHGNQWKIGPL